MTSSYPHQRLRTTHTNSSTNLISQTGFHQDLTVREPQYAQGLPQSSSRISMKNDTPYGVANRNSAMVSSISEKFSLAADPMTWGANLSPSYHEPDDDLHMPDPKRDRKVDMGGHFFTARGLANLGCLFILIAGLLTLFAGYPLISHFTAKKASKQGGFNIGGTNATGQVPSIGNFALIDADTPSDAHTVKSWKDGSTEFTLVFSDEFNTDGRTFYPGDDPYWEAADLHYYSTNDLEYYDPAAITTSNGSLVITLEKKETHNLSYQSGMMSTWNKFCFTGGMFMASVVIPGMNDITGFWPAIWTLGNLGRAGYGATLEGLWPYTYDSCDVGTAPNQTKDGVPAAAATGGTGGAALSYLPGQRLSRCTCPGQSHPGPVHSDGTYVGRGAPEIDMFEAQISDYMGWVSQTAQWAPFNYNYEWFNTTDNYSIHNSSISELNSYAGSPLQQASSVITQTNTEGYEYNGMVYSIYGFEYKPGFDGAYVSWISNNQLAWTVLQGGFAADSRVNISSRPVPQEPMYLIMNFGMSWNFETVDLDHLPFPARMYVDWVRVYQPSDSINIGCDPEDFPTAAYIDEYIEAYTNYNYTTWTGDFGQTWPTNSFVDGC